MRISDWSSDVCSSDLVAELFAPTERIDPIPWHPQLDIPSRRSAQDEPRPAANLLTPRHGTGGTQREDAYMVAKQRRSLRRIANPRFLRCHGDVEPISEDDLYIGHAPHRVHLPADHA